MRARHAQDVPHRQASGLISLVASVLVGSLDPGLIPKFKRTATFTESDYELLLVVLSRFGRIITTPHVLAEVSNLAGGLSGAYGEQFCAMLSHFIERSAEHYDSAESLTTEETFCRLGLSDAGVARVASSQQLEVVTVDLDLWLALQRAGVTAHNFNHVRDLGRFD